jgi:FkbM family methyltransferase
MNELFNKIIYFSILLRTFNYLNKINYFVQVGAHDGKMHDPLYSLLSKNNWNGVLIEPQKKMIQRFKRRYNERDNLQYFNLAVHPSKTTIKLYSLKNPENYSQTGWSSILPERFSLILNKNTIGTELVKAKPLMSIIKDSKFRIVDLLQIDTEGYDYEVLKMFDFHVFRPIVVQYEHIHLSKDVYEKSKNLLIGNGYLIINKGSDTISIDKKVINLRFILLYTFFRLKESIKSRMSKIFN